ncbi:MAG TPA: DUF6622 family protein [Variovorax sp.]|nr:DUF6622 family protein [Variovorax sp.]
MLLQILAHTPKWVFAIFIGLLLLGARQLRGGRVGLLRMTLMPLAMSALSFYGVVSVFGEASLALLGWAGAACAAAAYIVRRPLPAGTRYDPSARTFQLAGTGVPLALMMGIFFTKYAVGVLLVMHPQLAHQAGFAAGIGTLYGAFAGIFAARSLRLWKLAMRRDAVRFPAAIPE